MGAGRAALRLPAMGIGIYTTVVRCCTCGERTCLRSDFWADQDVGSWSEYISISSVTATYGSALTAAHFWKSPKVSKRLLPHHLAPRLGSVFPHSGLNPWAAATRHPWRGAANPASCRFTHGFKPAFGQRGQRGAQDQDQVPEPEPEPDQKITDFVSVLGSRSYTAHAPTIRSALRPPRFVFDLRRPVNHAGRSPTLIWGVNRQDAGLAALGQGWPIAAAPQINVGVRACRA